MRFLHPVGKNLGGDKTTVFPIPYLYPAGGRERGISHQPQEHVENQLAIGNQMAPDVAQ
jgi:hypothetical protein